MSSSLEEKLREIKIHRLNRHNADRITEYLTLVDETIEEIIQAFKDEGWVTPENAKKVQSMVNQMANLANDAFRMPTTIHLAVSKDQKTAQRLMTGQEWYDLYKQEKGFGSLDNLKDIGEHGKTYFDGIDHAVIKCDEAAQRASGISSEENTDE